MPALVLIEDMEWTDEEQAVLARAETLRSNGRRSEAANLVAAGCVLPQNFSDRDVLRAELRNCEFVIAQACSIV